MEMTGSFSELTVSTHTSCKYYSAVDNVVAMSMQAQKDRLASKTTVKGWGVSNAAAVPEPVVNDDEYPSLSDAMVIPLAYIAAEFPALDLPTIDVVRERLRKKEEGEASEGDEEHEDMPEGFGEDVEGTFETPVQFKSSASKLREINEKIREEKKEQRLLERSVEEEEEEADEEEDDEGHDGRVNHFGIATSNTVMKKGESKSHILFSSGGADVKIYEDDDDGEGW
jgi:hypothetical protein